MSKLSCEAEINECSQKMTQKLSVGELMTIFNRMNAVQRKIMEGVGDFPKFDKYSDFNERIEDRLNKQDLEQIELFYLFLFQENLGPISAALALNLWRVVRKACEITLKQAYATDSPAESTPSALEPAEVPNYQLQ